jgi:signal transduction histidine kinase
MEARALAAQIEQGREALLEAWLERVLSRPGSLYRQRPADQVRLWLSDAVDAVVCSLSTGSEEPLRAHAAAIGASRQRLGFRIDEVVDALLQLKEAAAVTVIGATDNRQVSARDASELLDCTLRSLVSAFAADFAGALREQEQQLTALHERQRLARDLHDAVSQSLYAVSLHAGAALRLLHAEDTAGVEDNLQRLRDAARQALADMRLLIFELRPSALPDEGLVEALRTRLAAVESRAGIRATLQAAPQLEMPAAVEAALFGIASEALNNSLKHAEATSMEVTLQVEDGRLVLQVADDGKGFEAEGARGGLGLSGMQERATAIGAELSVAARPGAGTVVRVVLPLIGLQGEEHG